MVKVNVGHQTLDIWHQTSDFGHQISDILRQKTNISHRTSDIGHGEQTSDIRYQPSHITHRTSNIRHQTSDLGHQASDISASWLSKWEPLVTDTEAENCSSRYWLKLWDNWAQKWWFLTHLPLPTITILAHKWPNNRRIFLPTNRTSDGNFFFFFCSLAELSSPDSSINSIRQTKLYLLKLPSRVLSPPS